MWLILFFVGQKAVKSLELVLAVVQLPGDQLPLSVDLVGDPVLLLSFPRTGLSACRG
jgi:hypothetical protein